MENREVDVTYGKINLRRTGKMPVLTRGEGSFRPSLTISNPQPERDSGFHNRWQIPPSCSFVFSRYAQMPRERGDVSFMDFPLFRFPDPSLG